MSTALSDLAPTALIASTIALPKRRWQAANAAATLIALVAFSACGEAAHRDLRVPLPGPVVGIVLLASAYAAIAESASGMGNRLHDICGPLAQGLLRNMGLLFVPAGVGIVTELPVLHRAGSTLAAALVASTLIGVAVTYVSMRILASHAVRVATDCAPSP